MFFLPFILFGEEKGADILYIWVIVIGILGGVSAIAIDSYENNGSITFLVGLTMPNCRFSMPSASLDMNLRQCFRLFTPTATNSGTACFLCRRGKSA